MATSKTYSKTCSAVGSFSYAGNFKLYVKLEETSVSTSDNTSKVKYTVYCQKPSDKGGSIDARHLKYFKINGKEIINETVNVDVSGYPAKISIASGTTDAISHNSDGSKSISFSAKIKGATFGVSASISDTFDLSDIPRYATSVQSLKSKTSSSITMNWSSDSTIDYIWYSKDNGSSWTGLNVTDGKSGSYTISSLSANTAYKIKTRVRRKDSQLTTDSSALSITTYAKTTPTITLSSKTVNSIIVNSGCNVSVSSTQYRIKKSDESYGSYQTSATFTGLSPNTAYVVEVKKVGSESGESGIATLNVTTHQIATISSGPNFNLGNSETVKYSNPSKSTINIGIYMTDGSTALAGYRTATATGTSYTFNFTDTELDTIYKKMDTSNTLKARLYLRTTCNGKYYYSTKDITITLTGNQKTIHQKISSAWKRGKVYIKKDGTWKQGVIWQKINGIWKRGI